MFRILSIQFGVAFGLAPGCFSINARVGVPVLHTACHFASEKSYLTSIMIMNSFYGELKIADV